MLARKALAGTAGAAKEYVEDVFSSYLYVGNGSTQTITNNIDLSGEGGLVWTKCRNTTWNNAFVDTVRGGGSWLNSNDTAAAGTGTYLTFNTDGYLVNNSFNNWNGNTNTYVSWTFRKAKKFFDVVTFTTSGSEPPNTGDISHNLGSTPGCVIVKSTSGSQDWKIYHRSLSTPTNKYLQFDTGAVNDAGTAWINVSSTTISFPGSILDPGVTYVAYLFAHDAGGFGDAGSDSIIKCGSFTTNGAGSATIDLGWEPQWVLQRHTTSGSWWMTDNMLGFNTAGTVLLRPHLNSAEYTDGNDYMIPSATGFSVKYWSADTTFIYIAIRKGPMKTPETGTSVFAQTAFSGNDTSGTRSAGLNAFDLLLTKRRNGAADFVWLDKLRGLAGNRWLSSASTSAEVVNGGTLDTISTINGQYTQDGINITKTSNYSYVDSNGYDFVWYALKRAPKFFDQVCYTGNGTANRAITHNLGVTPELIIVKDRSAANLGMVYAASEGAGKFLRLFAGVTGDYASTTNSSPWNDTAPTSTQFTVDGSGSYQYVNATGDSYIAYLFASLSGVSKVGSYTGNGSNGLQINCGFTNGARFVIIKRTDSANDWHVFDTARGIVSGNDPYLKLNKTDVEVTTDDIVDTYSSGFIVNAFNGVNANGGTYIYLAIA